MALRSPYQTSIKALGRLERNPRLQTGMLGAEKPQPVPSMAPTSFPTIDMPEGPPPGPTPRVASPVASMKPAVMGAAPVALGAGALGAGPTMQKSQQDPNAQPPPDPGFSAPDDKGHAAPGNVLKNQQETGDTTAGLTGNDPNDPRTLARHAGSPVYTEGGKFYDTETGQEISDAEMRALLSGAGQEFGGGPHNTGVYADGTLEGKSVWDKSLGPNYDTALDRENATALDTLKKMQTGSTYKEEEAARTDRANAEFNKQMRNAARAASEHGTSDTAMQAQSEAYAGAERQNVIGKIESDINERKRQNILDIFNMNNTLLNNDRADAPDLYNKAQQEVAGVFGPGATVSRDGKVYSDKGGEIKYADMTAEQKAWYDANREALGLAAESGGGVRQEDKDAAITALTKQGFTEDEAKAWFEAFLRADTAEMARIESAKGLRLDPWRDADATDPNTWPT